MQFSRVVMHKMLTAQHRRVIAQHLIEQRSCIIKPPNASQRYGPIVAQRFSDYRAVSLHGSSDSGC